MTEAAVIVIPCFDEATRFDTAAMSTLLEGEGTSLLFVDDGSRDDTRAVLERFAGAHPGRATVLALDRNQGKAEAVRQGLLRALDDGAAIVAYADADLATPPRELLRLLDVLRTGDAQVVFGSRVALLGRTIERTLTRHYLGRVFATAASITLRLPVYDTQCGAKLFRASPMLRAALAEPFASRWVFDVELLGRLASPAPGQAALPISAFVEEPLRAWRDVAGSKLRRAELLGAAMDLARVARRLRDRRRGR